MNHDHGEMTPEQLTEHNIAELNRGIADLVIHNESRLALIRDDRNPWVELQFEMLSFKLDLILAAMLSGVPDPTLRLAEYGMDFQLRLAGLLDSLFPTTVPPRTEEEVKV